MNLIVTAPFRGHSQSSTWGSFMAKYVLIVDDNEAIRRTLRYLFKENPEWTICGEATNGRDALEKAHELQPDLVILDFSMPVMNGLETATMLKKTSPTSDCDADSIQRPVLRAAGIQRRGKLGAVKDGGREHRSRFCENPSECFFPAVAARIARTQSSYSTATATSTRENIHAPRIQKTNVSARASITGNQISGPGDL